jgi:hypothetical protein
MTCCMTITKGGLLFMTRQMLLNSLAGVNPYYFFPVQKFALTFFSEKVSDCECMSGGNQLFM